MIAAIAVKKGDYARAEITLRTGLETFTGSPDLHYSLTCLYRTTKHFEQAQAQLAALKRYETSERVAALEQALAADSSVTGNTTISTQAVKHGSDRR